MTGKADREFLFETQLNWVAGTMGVLSARTTEGIIQTATPPAFGGEGRFWSPEHLLLGAVCGDVMTTFLAISAREALEVSRFECNATGLIRETDGRYRYTQIELWPKVFVPSEEMHTRASQVMERTRKNCLVANSLNAEIYFHGLVLTESSSGAEFNKRVA